MGELTYGTVKWFDSKKGFGFIAVERGMDVFVDYTGVVGVGFRWLEAGQEVTFEIRQGRGGPEAREVRVIGPQ